MHHTITIIWSVGKTVEINHLTIIGSISNLKMKNWSCFRMLIETTCIMWTWTFIRNDDLDNSEIYIKILIRLLYVNLTCQLINKILFDAHTYRWKRYMVVTNFGHFYFRLLASFWCFFFNYLLHNKRKSRWCNEKSEARHPYTSIQDIATTISRLSYYQL